MATNKMDNECVAMEFNPWGYLAEVEHEIEQEESYRENGRWSDKPDDEETD